MAAERTKGWVLEANGVTTPLSRHGKVSSPPRRKLIPNPSSLFLSLPPLSLSLAELSTNNFGSPPRLFRVTALSFHRERAHGGLPHPLSFSLCLSARSCLFPFTLGPPIFPTTAKQFCSMAVHTMENLARSRSFRRMLKRASRDESGLLAQCCAYLREAALSFPPLAISSPSSDLLRSNTGFVNSAVGASRGFQTRWKLI